MYNISLYIHTRASIHACTHAVRDGDYPAHARTHPRGRIHTPSPLPPSLPPSLLPSLPPSLGGSEDPGESQALIDAMISDQQVYICVY